MNTLKTKVKLTSLRTLKYLLGSNQEDNKKGKLCEFLSFSKIIDSIILGNSLKGRYVGGSLVVFFVDVYLSAFPFDLNEYHT